MDNLNINVGAVVSIVITLSSFLGAVAGIAKYLKKGLTNFIVESNKPIEDKLEVITKDVNAVKMENCKNYIVNFLSKVETGEKTTNDQLRRFSENYDLYRSMGGNSYIKDWVERLKAEGKLDHKPVA